MPIGVEDVMAVEDVRCSDEALEKIFKSHLLAFWEVTGGHVVDDGLHKASCKVVCTGSIVMVSCLNVQ